MWQYLWIEMSCKRKQKKKQLKYKSWCIEIQPMCNKKSMIILLITKATGIVTKGLKKNLKTIPWKNSIDSLQKTAILGTSHTMQEVLQSETWSLSGGDHCWFKRSTRKKRPVTETTKQNKTTTTTKTSQ